MNAIAPAAWISNERRGLWHECAYWVCQVLGWGLFILGSHYGHASVSVELAARLVNGGSGLVLTHLLREFIRRRDWIAFPIWKFFFYSISGALVIGTLMTVAMVLFEMVAERHGVGMQPIKEVPRWVLLPVLAIFFVVLVLIWEGIYFGVHLFWRHQREETERWKLETALTSAELGTLKAQLNPHFLFNCLNGLRALVVEDPARAQDVITRLASVLRYSLQSSATPTVTLERELQTVDDYLNLEAIRFEERLKVRREIDPASLGAQVPPMIVQTLVENAIKYGISKHLAPGEIEITSRLTNSEVMITVSNQGRIEPNPESTGLGLRNATDRLRRIFGAGASVTLEQLPNDQLVRATIRLPFHHQPPFAAAT